MEFTTDIFSQFDKKWALLTAGDKDKFNTMTIIMLLVRKLVMPGEVEKL